MPTVCSLPGKLETSSECSAVPSISLSDTELTFIVFCGNELGTVLCALEGMWTGRGEG